MAGRLALKRKDGNAEGPAVDEGPAGRKKVSAEQAQKPHAQQPEQQPSADTWAAGFAAEAAGGAAAEPPAAATEHEEAAAMSEALSMDEDAGAPGDEEARQGLLKVVESMRRRADDGHVQLLRQRRLLEQKQGLAARGEAVLAHHAAASWRQQQLPALAPAAVTVHSLQAHCVAGQWWLAAVLSLPAEWRRLHAGGAVAATLLAASRACGLVCRQQQCTTSSRSAAGARAAVQLHLTARLDVQQQGQQALQAAGAAWADVFLLMDSAGTAADDTAATAAPPVQLGRVQLSRQQWLSSYAASDGAQQQQQLPSPVPAPQLSRALVVEARQLHLQCLHSIVQQQLACVTSDGGDDSDDDAGPQRRSYALPGLPHQQQQQPPQQQPGDGSAAGVPAAAVHVTQHGARFAQVELQAGSAAMLDALQQQLAAGLRQAAAAAGAPPDDAAVSPSLLAPGKAGVAVGAADALVREVDASIEWIEALLKERLALDSQAWRRRAAPDPAVVRQAQAATLAAAAATDGRLMQLLASGAGGS